MRLIACFLMVDGGIKILELYCIRAVNVDVEATKGKRFYNCLWLLILIGMAAVPVATMILGSVGIMSLAEISL